jgi:hypothetical protein
VNFMAIVPVWCWRWRAGVSLRHHEATGFNLADQLPGLGKI